MSEHKVAIILGGSRYKMILLILFLPVSLTKWQCKSGEIGGIIFSKIPSTLS